MTEIDRAQLAALDASGMHNTGRMAFEYGEFDTVKDDITIDKFGFSVGPATQSQCSFKYYKSSDVYECRTCNKDEFGDQWRKTEGACLVRELSTPLETQIGGSHYKDMAIQPLDYIMKNGLGFAEGNVVKYVSRWRVKGGVEDLRKARHYLDVLIEGEGEK